MSELQLNELNFFFKLEHVKTTPVKKQGRIARVYQPMHKHYLQVIEELNAQKTVNKLSLEVIQALLEMIKKNHPPFF